MVLAYDLTIDGKENAELVLQPNGLYLLPDRTLASLSSSLIWCLTCGDFRVGERIETREWLEQQLAAPLDDEVSRFMYGDNQQAIDRYHASLRRTLHWLELRRGPPLCLDCGAAVTSYLSCDHDETFVDRRGRTVSYSLVFANTTIDHSLRLFAVEGKFLGEISRICPVTNAFIDDAYDYDKVLEMLRNSD